MIIVESLRNIMESGIDMNTNYKKAVLIVFNTAFLLALSLFTTIEIVETLNKNFYEQKINSYHEQLKEIKPYLYPKSSVSNKNTYKMMGEFIGKYDYNFICNRELKNGSCYDQKESHNKQNRFKIFTCNREPKNEPCSEQENSYDKQNLIGENLLKYIKSYYLEERIGGYPIYSNNSRYVYRQLSYGSRDFRPGGVFLFNHLYNWRVRVRVPGWSVVSKLVERNVHLNAMLYNRSYQEELDTWVDYQTFSNKHSKKDITYEAANVFQIPKGASLLMAAVLAFWISFKSKGNPTKVIVKNFKQVFLNFSNLDKILFLTSIFWMLIVESYFLVFEYGYKLFEIYDDQLGLVLFPILSAVVARFFYWIYEKTSN